MPANQVTSPATDDDQPPGRNRLPIILVALVLGISAAVAALVIFSGDTDPMPAKDPVAAVSAGSGSLSVGPTTAPLQVEIAEDFGSAASREFDIASRDFLRIEAADGHVRVDYHPVAASTNDFSSAATRAWSALLQTGTPKQALAFHDLLFDQQPSADEPTSRQFIALAKQSGVQDSLVLDAVAAANEGSASLQSPATRSPATPDITVGGKPLTAATPTALADALQRMVLRAEP